MAIVTPSMGLKRWNLPNDVYSYVELSDNFALIDSHDHTLGKGNQIPTAGIANLAVDSTKLASDAVTISKIPVNTITGDRVVNSTLPDTKFASPNNVVWRTLQNHAVIGTSSMGAGTVYGLTGNGGIIASGVGGGSAPLLFPFVASHYAVAAKATKLRVLGAVITNATTPVTNVTLALNPVSTVGGGANNLLANLAAAVSGSAVTAISPTSSSRITLTGSEFDAPADGFYALTVSASAAPAANSALGISVMLQIRHV